jgi:hypothetical protein
MGREHDRSMLAPAQPARDLVDDNLGARPERKCQVGDQDREGFRHD